MSLREFLAGLANNPERHGADQESQLLMAALLVLVAQCDGGITADESVRMVELLRQRFGIQANEALSLINRGGDRLEDLEGSGEIMRAARENLGSGQKEELMLMILNVIAADSRKDAAEMQLLGGLIENLGLSDKSMEKIYARYFDTQ